jgi:uncharacterized protein (DUF302 family)
MAITTEVNGSIEQVSERVAEAIKPAGFGVLTRIEFDQKIREKTGESLNRCLILGACNPHLALEAYKKTTDAALLIPCNIVLTEVKVGRIRVEAIRPSEMLRMLPGVGESAEMKKAEQDLEKALLTI